MRQVWLIALLLVAGLGLAAAALPLALYPGGGVTGGGASAASAGLRLTGAMGGLSTVLSQSGALRLEGGPLPALTATPPPNAADRHWLTGSADVPVRFPFR